MSRETKRPQRTDSEELPDLTPKQLAFVQGILQGMTASDAYRAAYDAESMSPETLWVQASLVKSNDKVAIWLAQARLHCLTHTAVTLEGHTAELESLKQEARQAGAYGASIKAEELKGRANGLYVDQIKTDTGQADVLQALAAIGKVDPALAKQLGERLGLPESDTGATHNPGSKLTH